MNSGSRAVGRPAAGGIAVGSALLLHAAPLPVVPQPIPPERVEDELARLDAACRTAGEQLSALREQVREALGERFAAMLDAQRLILDDPLLIEPTRTRIRVGRTSARWALKEVVSELLRRFDAVPDEYLRERGGELADVHGRLQRLLRGEAGTESPLPDGPLVVVAHSIGPSDTVLLTRRRVVGLATDLGGATSHASILARALSIPAVVGLRDLSRRVRAGQSVLVDGMVGEVVLEPSAETIADAERRRDEQHRIEIGAPSLIDRPPVTVDGTEIVIRANVEFDSEIDRAGRIGTHGIGLFRSEFLYLQAMPGIPDEHAHARAYAELASAVAPHPVIVRTLDAGGDKLPSGEADELPEAAHPALGRRGIRLCLARPDLFVPQLRGLLRAAADHPTIRVLVPMVTATEELREVRRLLAREAAALRAEGVATPERIPVGAMLEVPAAALASDEIATEAAFLSLGTNDLLQYGLAADRGDERLVPWLDPRHRGIWRLIDLVVRAAERAGRPLSICGELAADPAAVPWLLGLGLRELSVHPGAAPAVRDAVRGVRLDEARREVAVRLAPVAREDPAGSIAGDD